MFVLINAWKSPISNFFDDLREQGEALTKNHISDGVLSDFVSAIFSLFQFENSTEAGVGAHCNKMIMLLTDGSTDNGDEVFKRRNFNRPLKVISKVSVKSTQNGNLKRKFMSLWLVHYIYLTDLAFLTFFQCYVIWIGIHVKQYFC